MASSGPVRPQAARAGRALRSARPTRGWTVVELMAVLVLLAVVLLVAGLSVMRGKTAADELTCQDNMRAIQSALEVYYLKHDRTYPADQAEFERFLRDRTYFGVDPADQMAADELRCPLDREHAYHYQYRRDATTGAITVSCPVPGSGHGSVTRP